MPYICCLDDDITRPTRDSLLARGFFIVPFDHEAEAQIMMLVPIERLS
jgi:hypothetical protein